MAARKRSDSETAALSGSGLPAKRTLGRQVVVIVGSDEQGLSILSRTLHALGVDMLEGEHADLWSGEGDHWARPWITALNDEILSALGRELGRPTHALPFPAGWWRRPAIQKIRRAMVKALDEALGDQTELWGFADLRTARLLPVWQDVFDELGLSPVYLWAVGDPSRAAGAGRRGQGQRAASMAEVSWFTYNADIFKYAGDRIAAIIDEAEWRDDPQPLMERLVGRLQLRWRGTRFDLFETVSAVLSLHEDDQPRPGRVAPSLPLATVLHKAILALEDDPDARARAETLVESAELLRPLIAPFLPSLENGSASGREERPAPTPRQAPPPEPAAEADDRITALQLEVEARVAETRWMRDQFRERLREAEAETEALRQQLEAAGSAPAGRAGDDEDMAAAHSEIQRLQSEMVNLSNANERYLARIYELKKALEDRGDFEPFGG